MSTATKTPNRERDRVRRALAQQRVTEQTVHEHEAIDRARKDACEADIYLFLRTYFPKIFFHDFTEDQRAMIDAILYRLKYGGCQAIAAPRGGGKTMITSFVTLYCLLFGLLKFVMIVGATRPKSIQVLDNIKKQLRRNELLFEDFPEVCCYVRYVSEAPQRAANCKASDGTLVNMVWHQDHIILPTREGSRASGGMVSATGITADDIRGQCIEGVRPDLVILDDVDTRESASSDTQTETREQTIQEDIMGLAAPGDSLAVVMLCTVINRQCLAYLYTDPKIRPAWHGKRYKLLDRLPDDQERWQRYMELRLSGMQSGEDPDGRVAHAFYIANRSAMDEGSAVSNKYSFNGKLLPDGSQIEVSALQNCYNRIADASKEGKDGWNHFATEYQNDPPVESGPEASGITALLVQSRLHGYAHRTLPDSLHALTIGVDIGVHRFHWVAIAWRPGAIGFIVDYDEYSVVGTSREDTVQLTAEKAILQALVNLRQQWIEEPFITETGEIVEPKLVMIDSGSGLHQESVYQFCRSVGHRPFAAAKGFARGNGMTPFYYGKATPTRRIGDHWFQARQDTAPDIWLHGFDADYWKRWVHQRFLTPTEDENGDYRTGTLSLWRSKQSHRHAKFARQIEAEVWTTDFVEGKTGAKEYWERRHRDNHYLDAAAMACAAGSMAGVKIVGEVKSRKAPISIGELAERARKRSA